MRFFAEFNPQAWFNDYAISVDPMGDTVWDVTRFMSMVKPELRAACCVTDSHESDVFKDDPAAPQWIREWSGPFYITLSVEPETDQERDELRGDDEPASYVDRLGYLDPETAPMEGDAVQPALAAVTADASAVDDAPGARAYVVVQEGGSSEEIYIHASDTEHDAEAFRVSCRDEGSYRTSGVIEVPAELVTHGEVLYALLEQVARADLGFPERVADERLADAPELTA